MSNLGLEFVDRSVAALPFLQHPGVHRQLDHYGLTLQPRLLKRVQSGARVGDGSSVDDDLRTIPPRRGRSDSGRHDHASAELREVLGWPSVQPNGVLSRSPAAIWALP